MSWAIGYDSMWQRDIGYGVPATCDHPDCDTRIDRGLSFVCGDEPYGGEAGCGLYFCARHRSYEREGRAVCGRCARGRQPYVPKPDVPEWTAHKLTDPSWAIWRDENPDDVKRLLAAQP